MNRNDFRTPRGGGTSTPWVVVTGANGGIGSAVVSRLLDDGWSVLATDREAIEKPNAKAGDRLRTAAMNVTDLESIRSVCAGLGADELKGLVNVAGLLQDVVPFFEMSDAQMRRVWEVNYFGAQSCMRIFGARMAETSGGSIVNITSINEIRPLPLHAYAPAKAALGSLTSLVAGELGAKGVRVNAVAPGFTLTPIFQRKIDAGQRTASVLEGHAAMGRLVQVEEVASAVSFLLSNDASAITGATLPVDCGWLASSHWMDFRSLVGERSST